MWPHRKLALRMSTGYNAMGSVEISGLFSEAPKPARSRWTNYCQLQQNGMTSSSCPNRRQMQRKFVPQHMRRLQKASGQAILALSVGPEIRSQRLESRSEIGLWQGEKFRPIEDGKRSRYNEAQGIQEKVHTCPVEFPAMVAMGCTNDWPGVAMVVRARDRHRRFAGRVQGQSDR